MPQLLVSVADPGEAEIAVAGGADLIDAKDPAHGALGALPVETIRAILGAVAGRRTVTAVTGNATDPAAVLDAAETIAATGVGMVKIGLFPGCDRARLLADLGRRLARRTRLVGVVFADREPDTTLVGAAAAAGFAGIMIDTAGKDGGLFSHLDDDWLSGFVAEARARHLLVGLAGSLRVADAERLVRLAPDLVGFRGGLCEGLDRRRPLRAEAVAEAKRRLVAAAAATPRRCAESA